MNRATLVMVLVAITLVIIMLSISDSLTYKGWFAAIGASFIFGSTGVPMKRPPSIDQLLSQPEIQIDPILFAVWSSVGIFFVSLPLVVYIELCFAGGFLLKPWALLGSIDIVVISFLTFHAVQMLGYSRAPAIWARSAI